MDLDEYQAELGGISRYQVVVILSASLLTFGSGFMTQSAVFLSGVPTFRCAVPPIDSEAYNLTEAEIHNLTMPDPESDQSCSRYAYNYSYCSVESPDLTCLTAQGAKDDDDTEDCEDGYHYDTDVYEATTITEWDLVCDRQYLDSLANTFFFLGFFIGSLLIGPLADWFGRRVAMRIVCLGLVVTSIGCSFTPTYELYVFVRVLTASFAITCFISLYTYVNEISDIKWRTEAGAYANFMTALSHTIYPWICYALREWRQIHFVISFIPLPFLVVSIFLPETPIWLLSNGKYKDARKVLGRYATSKGKTLTDETWEKIMANFEEKKKAEKNVVEERKKIGIWDLFRRPIMRIMCINVMFCWFTVSMVFYGLALNGGNLSGDPYLNNSLNGLVEIAAYIAVYFAGPFGRRPVLSAGYIVGGVFCIASMLCDIYANDNQDLLNASTGFAITGKLFATLAFALVYAVTSEIFPSNARATSISMGSMAARVGGMISPFVLQLQTTIPWFTQTLFGSLSILSGLLTFLYPETNKIGFINTLDEAETFYRDNISLLKICRKNDRNSETIDEYDKKVEMKEGQENTVYSPDDDDKKYATKL